MKQIKAILFLIAVFLSSVAIAQSDEGPVKSLTDDSFEKAISKGIVVVDFWATWCGPCKMQAPRFKEAAFEARDLAKFYKVDVDECQTVSSVYNITSIPTLIIYKDGKVAQRMVGLSTKQELVDAIKKMK